MHFNTNDEVNYISTNLKNRNYETIVSYKIIICKYFYAAL